MGAWPVNVVSVTPTTVHSCHLITQAEMAQMKTQIAFLLKNAGLKAQLKAYEVKDGK